MNPPQHWMRVLDTKYFLKYKMLKHFEFAEIPTSTVWECNFFVLKIKSRAEANK